MVCEYFHATIFYIMKRSLLFSITLLLGSIIGNAQTQVIATFDQAISEAVLSNGKLFFTAVSANTGRELWCTDGTESGTYLVKDINPGSSSAFDLYFHYTAIDHNGILYFKADDGTHGTELWRSDGTEAGTYLLKEFTVGSTGSAIGEFASVGNKLYFVSGTNSNALWKSDGTTAGTVQITSFYACRNLIGWNGKVYFSAAPDNSSGEELWVSNGTVGSTEMVRDLNGAVGASLPINFIATPSRLFFMASTNIGWELWKTDGTYAGTQAVADINPNGNAVMNAYGNMPIVNVGDTVYFVANDGTNGFQLWRSDGSEVGTYRLTDMPGGVSATTGFPIVDGRVLFTSWGLSHFWSVDPETENVAVTGFPNHIHFSTGTSKFLFDEALEFYVAKDSIWGCEVWMADGADNGERLLQETHLRDNWSTATGQSFNSMVGTVNGHVLFTVIKGQLDSKQQLHAADIASLDQCSPPALHTAISPSATSIHFLWNRLPEADQYKVRYRPAGGANWTSTTTDRNFLGLINLPEDTDHEFQVQAECSGVWTDWSETYTHNTGATYTGSALHIVAEVAEDATTERIYWLKTDEVTSFRFRYRPFGTTDWVETITNSNGYRRVENLTSNTLYEYEYRSLVNGIWTDWNFSKGYFHTETETVTGITDRQEGRGSVYPNPTNDNLSIQLNEAVSNGTIAIIDLQGRTVLSRTINGTDRAMVDVTTLPSGLYSVVVSENGVAVIQERISVIR